MRPPLPISTHCSNSSAKESDSKLSQSEDSYGYHWVVVTDPELEDLVGTVHAVNTTLEEQGFGPQLLCSVFPFTDGPHTVHMVYLYKRGSFYPFAPVGKETRLTTSSSSR